MYYVRRQNISAAMVSSSSSSALAQAQRRSSLLAVYPSVRFLFSSNRGLLNLPSAVQNLSHMELSSISPQDLENVVNIVSNHQRVSYHHAQNSSVHEFCGEIKPILKVRRETEYSAAQKLPEFLPTEDEIDQLIASAGRKVSTLLQLIK